MSDPRPARAPEKVRQGSTGRPVLYVLLAALALALIAFAGMGLYGNSLPDENIPGPGVESGIETSAPPPATSDTGVVEPDGGTSAPAN